MSDGHKTKRRTRIWWVAIVAPVLYFPSYVPAVYFSHWMISLGAISQAQGNELIKTAYAPVVWAAIYCQMLCCKIVSGGVLHDSVNEEFSLEKGNDVLVAVEPSPALLGGVSQFEHHCQARSSCAAPLRAAVA